MADVAFALNDDAACAAVEAANEASKAGYSDHHQLLAGIEAYVSNLPTGEQPEGATRYVLTEDDDGHHYVIPASQQDAWDNWVNSDEADWGAEAPGWAQSVGGSPTLVTFTNPKIG